MKKKVLIIGSGFFGSVLAERLASQNNFKVEILEKEITLVGIRTQK